MSAKERKFWIFLTTFSLLLLFSYRMGPKKQHCHKNAYGYAYTTAYQMSQVDYPPQVINIHTVKKELKKSSSLQGIHGKVVAKVLVDKNGSYERHHIISSDNWYIKKRVDKYVSSLKFLSALKSDRPVRCWVTVTFQY